MLPPPSRRCPDSRNYYYIRTTCGNDRPAREDTSAARVARPAHHPKLTGDVVREEISARCATATTVLVSPRRAPLPPAGTVDCAATRRDAETLEAQLQPWSTPQLRRRLADEFSVETDPEAPRNVIMALLLTAYLREGLFDQRRIRRVRPVRQ